MPDPDSRRMAAILVLVAAVLFAAAPLATPGFGGYAPDAYPVPQADPPALPAGWAFAIWGVIYAWLVAHGAFGLLRRADDAGWQRTRWPLLAALGAGVPWLAVAVQSPVWATLLILAMAGAALLALGRAPLADRGWLALPLGLFAGWLTAASLVSVALLAGGWGLGPGLLWGWAAVLVAAILGVALQRRLPGVPTYGIAVAWALVGIAAANAGPRRGLALAALAAAAAVLLAAWKARGVTRRPGPSRGAS